MGRFSLRVSAFSCLVLALLCMCVCADQHADFSGMCHNACMFALQVNYAIPYVELPELEDVDMVLTQPNFLSFVFENVNVASLLWSLRHKILPKRFLYKTYTEKGLMEISARYPELFSFVTGAALLPAEKLNKAESFVARLAPKKATAEEIASMHTLGVLYLSHLF